MSSDPLNDSTDEPAPSARSMTDDLRAALVHANGNPITVGELLHVLRERGHALLMIVLALPFLVPVPTMGLSTPAGSVIALYGLCITLGMNPWIPKLLARRHVSYSVLDRVVGIACRAGVRVEKLLKPRLKFMLWPFANRFIGVCLIFLGLFLALPLPIPFTNAVPAFGLVLLLLGLIERDGVCVILGQIVCAILVVVLYLTWGLIVEMFRKMGGMIGWTQAECGANFVFAMLIPAV